MLTNINILGQVYTIHQVPCVDKECLSKGQINYMTHEILIDEGMPEDLKEQTLLHEVLHGVCDALGMEELNANENAIQSLATALHCIFGSKLFEIS